MIPARPQPIPAHRPSRSDTSPRASLTGWGRADLTRQSSATRVRAAASPASCRPLDWSQQLPNWQNPFINIPQRKRTGGDPIVEVGDLCRARRATAAKFWSARPVVRGGGWSQKIRVPGDTDALMPTAAAPSRLSRAVTPETPGVPIACAAPVAALRRGCSFRNRRCSRRTWSAYTDASDPLGRRRPLGACPGEKLSVGSIQPKRMSHPSRASPNYSCTFTKKTYSGSYGRTACAMIRRSPLPPDQ